MNAKYCDHCGKEEIDNDVDERCEATIATFNLTKDDESPLNTLTFDLCKKCARKLTDFLIVGKAKVISKHNKTKNE